MPVLISIRLKRRCIRLRALRQLADRILHTAGHAQSLLSLVVVGDRHMRSLNRTFRRKNKTTDVLAFATREGPAPHSLLLGDVVIALPQALRQARELGHEPDRELTMLLIHGVLHLCGYDHEQGAAEARRMARRERMILRAVTPIPRLLVSRQRVRV